jgi:hypothetical protein
MNSDQSQLQLEMNNNFLKNEWTGQTVQNTDHGYTRGGINCLGGLNIPWRPFI